MITRINMMGLTYTLMNDGPDKTIVSLGKKRITINCSLSEMSQRWYNWTMLGQFVQEAFNNLNPGEREFLMTGITNDEFDKIFASNEGSDESDDSKSEVGGN